MNRKTTFAGWTIPSESEILIEYLENKGWTTSDNIKDMLLGFDVTALVFAAAEALGLLYFEREYGSSSRYRIPSSPQIQLHSAGAFNQVYVLTFPTPLASVTGQNSSLQILARLPKIGKSFFPSRKLESIVATMTFSRECRGLPVPKVFAWNPHYDLDHNPVRCPYILMEFVSGLSLEEYWMQLCSRPRTNEREKIKEAIMEATAECHVRLCEPLPFWSGNKLGSLYFDWQRIDHTHLDLSNPMSYRVGALAHGYGALRKRHDEIELDPIGPAKDLRSLWRMCIRNELEMVHRIDTDGLEEVLFGGEMNKIAMEEEGRAFIDKLGVGMERWVESCFLPSNDENISLLSPCLIMEDWAFRNIIIDPATNKIRALVDWDDVYLLPFILSGRYPDDLCPTYGHGIIEVKTDQKDHWDFLPVDEDILVMPFPLPDMLKREAQDIAGPESGKTESHEHVLEWVQMNERIECTIWRGVYREKLTDLDSRFRFQIGVQGVDKGRHIKGFWEIRQEPMKIQRLLLYGWKEWVVRRIEIPQSTSTSWSVPALLDASGNIRIFLDCLADTSLLPLFENSF